MCVDKVNNDMIKITDDNKCVIYNHLSYLITYQICDDYYCNGDNFIDDVKFNRGFNEFPIFISPGKYVIETSSVFINQ